MSGAHAEREHALASPSSANRWLVEDGEGCLGSLALIEKFDPPNVDSVASVKGTLCHERAEKHLLAGTDPSTDNSCCSVAHPALGTIIMQPAEWQKHVVPYVRLINDLLEEKRLDGHEPALYVEKRLRVHESFCYGTIDVLIVVPEHSIDVVDLKAGRGLVSAKSKQLRVYLVGAVKSYAVGGETLTAHVSQAADDEEPHKKHEWSLKDIRKTHAAVKKASNDYKTAPCKEGEWCTFCPVECHCPLKQAKRRAALDAVTDEEGDFVPAEDLDIAELEAFVNAEDGLKKALEAAKKLLFGLHRDKRMPENCTTKLVQAKTNRAWRADITPEQVEEALSLVDGLEDFEAFTVVKKVKTITEVTKMLGKAEAHVIDGLTAKPVGGLKLVGADHKSPAFSKASVLEDVE